MTKVIVVNGPNLGRLGVREPDIYGRQDLQTLRKDCTEWGHALGLEVEVRQSDDEAEVIGWMHRAVDEQTPVVMNPAAFTHYSYGLSDAAKMVTDAGLPLMEVHISNPRRATRSASTASSARLPPAPSPAWASTATSSPSTPSPICWPTRLNK